LICEVCGRAVEFSGTDDLNALIERVEVGTGYRVDGHLLQLFGLCPDCQDG
jgi:Fe2+ or Zn2+ uptake regulation protein